MGQVCSENRGLASAGDVLRETHGEFVVSRYRLKQVDGIALVRSNRESGQQSLAFTSRPFILCGLPVRKPPPDQLLFERRNGNFLLQITGHPQFGLPFGQDRLVLIFLATLAVRQQSQVVRFRSAADMLDCFNLAKGGKEYRRIVGAFERIFGATIFFSSESNRSTATVVRRSRFNFLGRLRSGTAAPRKISPAKMSLRLPMSSTLRSPVTRSRPISKRSRFSPQRRRYWICSCGSAIAVS